MKQKQPLFWRLFFYLTGMVILALGLTLNVKAGLGCAAIVSLPYTLSLLLHRDYANLTLVLYCVLILAQLILKGKKRSWLDLAQIVVSVVFTRFLSLFQTGIPYQSGKIVPDLLVLLLAILCTGIGAAMTIGMRLVPNPCDGFVGCISDLTGKELGMCKNCVDLCFVTLSVGIGLCFGDPFVGIGLGTLVSVFGVGRVIAVFNRFARQPMERLAGLTALLAVSADSVVKYR